MCEQLHRTNAIPFGSRISGHLCKFRSSPDAESRMGSALYRSKWGGRAEQPEGSANGRSGHPDRYPNLQLTSLLSSRCRMPHATIMAGSAARIDERLNLEGERAGGYPNREHNP
jgi:hypothetical protein